MIHALLGALVLASSIVTTIEERATAHGVDPSALVALADCESRLDPYAVGAEGELGLFQLHPRGLLVDFYRRGYSDPHDAYESADYAAWAISNGLGRHWSCWR